jgi:uncharacterized protein (TIGR03435 family)
MITADLSPLWNHLWQSTLFAAVVWLLTVVLRRNRAGVRYWLWLAGSAKFLIPFSLLVSLGGQLRWRPGLAATRSQIAATVTEAGKSFFVTADLSPLMPASIQGNRLPAILLAVWFCGILLGIFFWFRLLQQIRTTMAAATPLDLSLPIPVLSSTARLEPGVFGILKPVLILPAGIAERLTTAQLEAVLTHELCHVRRNDNLTATVHMVVETIFWFHPVVWWIRRQLIAERERACDEQVVQSVDDRQAYAEGILNVCKLYLELRLECFSGITGGDLKQRVQRIMSQTAVCGLGRTKKGLLVAFGAIAMVGPVMVGLVSAPGSRAQTSASTPTAQPNATQAGRPKFEVASVKLSTERGALFVRPMPGGRLVATAPVKLLVMYAYAFQRSQIDGGPDWINDDRYEIEAKAGGNADRGQLMAMLQNLLEDRFQMKVHRESRETPVYGLVLGKNGPKLSVPKEATCPAANTPVPPNQSGAPPIPCGQMRILPSAAGVQMEGDRVPLTELVRVLAVAVDRPVIDKTNLPGLFDIRLHFMAEPPGAPPSDAQEPNVFNALQDQLGLKLDSTKGPVEFLVIDHVVRPSAN